ncbi:exo-1,4-beta-D-glucosaminidase [Dysgonomonas macrotermitis]|uniref:Exo-1,4-beta-D-glucosaminidase n=2 Tax=Dysgonomonas macrotermitis TaxID=1346286 RepID=A0A1M5FBY1_9BACT|nr:exo-1,4-beta-D-glucosaminidase [Dysgonomonas macrotermitis]
MVFKSSYSAIYILCCMLLLVSCGKNEKSEYKSIKLSENWKLHPSDSIVRQGEIIASQEQSVEGWFEAKVPSTVLGTLTANGLYGDAFVGKNITDIDKTQFDKSWWYRTEFDLPQLGDNQHVIIDFDGISYYANVWLNGKLVASRDSLYGTYRRFSFDITSFVTEKNTLAVEVFRGQAGDPNVGFADWNPRPADENMGIFREVTLKITGSAKLNNTYVHTKVNTQTLDEAWVTVETEVENLTDAPVNGELKGKIESISFTYPVSLQPNEKKKIVLTSEQVKDLHIKQPRLWWCNNMGNPELYDLELNFLTDNAVTYTDSVTFGIRQIEDFFDGDDRRGIKLNGKKVLLKSAGWTDDIFLRDTPETNELQVQYVKDMNMNMIRFENFWGTSQNIYDLCDKYGLLALVGWSCQWEWEAYYGKPCDETYGCILNDQEIDLIAESFADQVLWLRNHPSIIGWMPGSDMLPAPKLEEKYLAFLKESDSSRPYIGAAKERTSELSGKTGTKMAGPYEYVGPNYWYIDTKFGGAFGFNTETGIGAQLPVLESIEKFIPKDKLWPLNDYWGFHCTASATAMNSLKVLTEVMDNKYGKADNLEDYLLKADLINYDGTRAMFEAFRANIDKTTGIVQWMLNSAWPSLYWQLYDYYKVPTAAYYSVKKANQPIQLIYNYGTNAIHAVNETMSDIKGHKAVIQVFDTKSKLLDKKEVEVTLTTNTASEIFKLQELTGNIFVDTKIFNEEGELVADNFYCISAKQDEYDWDKTDWVHTSAKAYSDFKDLAQLPAITLDVKCEKAESGNDVVYSVTIKNTSSDISFFNNLKLKDNNGDIICPAFWSDNYISILPGEEKMLKCKISKHDMPDSTVTLEVKGWNCSRMSMGV